MLHDAAAALVSQRPRDGEPDTGGTTVKRAAPGMGHFCK
jgi:hypothetical protein